MTTPDLTIEFEITRKGKQNRRDEMLAAMRAEARDRIGDVDIVEEHRGESGVGRSTLPNDGTLTLTCGYGRRGTSDVPLGWTLLPAISSAVSELDTTEE